MPDDLPNIIKKISPSIVSVLAYNSNGKLSKQGSGFFVNEFLNIITNCHVVDDASRIEIKTADGNLYSVLLKQNCRVNAKVDLIQIGFDYANNVPHYKYLELSTTLPELGEKIIVIGTPFGLEQTVSDGIISGIREDPEIGKLIQITAPISPGSSGSPIVNMNGKVIGIATFGLMQRQNLNFAIPSSKIFELKPLPPPPPPPPPPHRSSYPKLMLKN